ncbi:MAG TPA: hypothetical protein VJJ83_03580 [Candidatus Babeliales bacterium]|nr:hypothetical protein [Candidatus Babeliales bacterium]
MKSMITANSKLMLLISTAALSIPWLAAETAHIEVRRLESKIDEVKSKLDDAKRSLSSELHDIKRVIAPPGVNFYQQPVCELSKAWNTKIENLTLAVQELSTSLNAKIDKITALFIPPVPQPKKPLPLSSNDQNNAKINGEVTVDADCENIDPHDEIANIICNTINS